MKRIERESEGKPSRKWPWILGVVLLLVAAMSVLFMAKTGKAGRNKGLNPLARLAFLLNEDTRFAPGYSDKAFYSIKLGDGEENVTNLLGAPLRTRTNELEATWVYASGPVPVYSSTGELGDEVDHTAFTFDATDRVKSVFGQVLGPKRVGLFSTSRTTYLSNSLGLSNDQIEKLKGNDFAEIERSFGKPRAVRESRAVKVLRYSDSPSSKNYRKPAIGIDATGKVVEVEDGYYWD